MVPGCSTNASFIYYSIEMRDEARVGVVPAEFVALGQLVISPRRGRRRRAGAASAERAPSGNLHSRAVFCLLIANNCSRVYGADQRAPRRSFASDLFVSREPGVSTAGEVDGCWKRPRELQQTKIANVTAKHQHRKPTWKYQVTLSVFVLWPDAIRSKRREGPCDFVGSCGRAGKRLGPPGFLTSQQRARRPALYLSNGSGA